MAEFVAHDSVELVFVEGNAELTPARLVGTFDPARVLADGYAPEVFLDGPLVEALRTGALLYVEEVNRVPEETLNVVITAMSERELHVPRLGRVEAAPGFRVVAAMNPFDAIGTARISSAVYDRVCRVAMGYQDEVEEQEIVAREAPATGAGPVGRRAVRVVRATREHPDVRIGSSTWTYADPASAEWWGSSQATGYSSPVFAAQAAELGVGAGGNDEIASGWRTWGSDPDAWFVVLHGELLARPS